MTDKHAGYLVILDKDLREDDAQKILDAILMVKGVQEVTPVVSDPITAIANCRAKRELANKLVDVMTEILA